MFLTKKMKSKILSEVLRSFDYQMDSYWRCYEIALEIAKVSKDADNRKEHIEMSNDYLRIWSALADTKESVKHRIENL